ncbi:unnamed protein product [Hermetia illucens]|uniref:Uncharacterized protein n=1 Tax=Hermetia illucens TaxID=343691 RepID=A0A7R8UNB1_HERIL|nr:unnamed protein product [Hermetia illucens]
MTISFEKQYTGNEEKPYEKRKTGKYVIMIFATKISRKSGQHAGTRELSSRACSKQKVDRVNYISKYGSRETGVSGSAVLVYSSCLMNRCKHLTPSQITWNVRGM